MSGIKCQLTAYWQQANWVWPDANFSWVSQYSTIRRILFLVLFHIEWYSSTEHQLACFQEWKIHAVFTSIFFFTVFVELLSTLRLCNGINPHVSFRTRRCFCRLELQVNRSLQPGHSYCLTPSWASSCCLWSVGFLNDLKQWRQVYGFWFVWIRMWIWSVFLLFRTRPHISHVNVFFGTFSLWPFTCLLNWPRPTYRAPQMWQE